MTQKGGPAFLGMMRNELQPRNLLPNLMMGRVNGVVEVIFALSPASLLFPGNPAPYFAYGLGISVVTSVVLLTCTSLFSSIPGIFCSTQDTPTVIFAVMVTSLAGTLVSTNGTDKLDTILTAIFIATFLTGLLFLILGYFKLGKLVRYIPYPVMAGFLAGVGWLLVKGSFSVTTDYSLTTSNIPTLLQPDQLKLWMPGILFALLLFLCARRSNHFLTVPVILIGSIGLLYLAFFLTGISIEEATAQGFLLGEVGGIAIWQPMALSGRVLHANWPAILGQGGNIANFISIMLPMERQESLAINSNLILLLTFLAQRLPCARSGRQYCIPFSMQNTISMSTCCAKNLATPHSNPFGPKGRQCSLSRQLIWHWGRSKCNDTSPTTCQS